MKNSGEPNGILNLKNTCYINSVVQLLSLCQELISILEKENNLNSEFLYLLGEILNSLNNGTGKTIKPQAFIKSSFDAFPNFLPYRQQDSLEYINYVFCKIFENAPNAENLFKGKQIQIMKCSKCKNVMELEDYFNTLAIPIPRYAQTACPSFLGNFFDQFSEISFEDCLRHYFSCEKRSFMNCSVCQESKSQIITEHIQYSSQYLIIYLKRYTGSYWKPKILTLVRPPQYFSGKLLNPNDKSNYRLLGLIEHSSYLIGGRGHYTCYILKNNSWYFISDSTVKKVKWQDVSKAQAYIMLFKKL